MSKTTHPLTVPLEAGLYICYSKLKAKNRAFNAEHLKLNNLPDFKGNVVQRNGSIFYGPNYGQGTLQAFILMCTQALPSRTH